MRRTLRTIFRRQKVLIDKNNGSRQEKSVARQEVWGRGRNRRANERERKGTSAGGAIVRVRATAKSSIWGKKYTIAKKQYPKGKVKGRWLRAQNPAPARGRERSTYSHRVAAQTLILQRGFLRGTRRREKRPGNKSGIWKEGRQKIGFTAVGLWEGDVRGLKQSEESQTRGKVY